MSKLRGIWNGVVSLASMSVRRLARNDVTVAVAARDSKTPRSKHLDVDGANRRRTAGAAEAVGDGDFRARIDI
jgi:hypothetical protein